MPVICSFFGIVIRMYYWEHGLPHFHVEYQGERATFRFTGALLAGALSSPSALRLVAEWATLHRDDLDANWDRARRGQPLEPITSLE